MMNTHSNSEIIFKMTSKKTEPSKQRKLQIKLSFLFKTDAEVIINERHDSTARFVCRHVHRPSSTVETSITFLVKESPSLAKDIAQAAEKAIGPRLNDNDREYLIAVVLEEIDATFPNKTLNPKGFMAEKALPNFMNLYLRFEIGIKHLQLKVIENGRLLMDLAAADSSVVGFNDVEEKNESCHYEYEMPRQEK